jgi:hypothetical protein
MRRKKMKYIIDIPDDTSYLNIVKLSEGCVAKVKTVYIPDLTPYTEPDRKQIEDEVWELARKIADMGYEEFSKCFDVSDDYLEVNIMDVMTYSEAKAKYEAWERDNIRVGDEVIPMDTKYDTMIVTRTWKDDYWSDCVDTVGFNGSICSFLTSKVKKTGRHFDEVEELLKKMKGEE